MESTYAKQQLGTPGGESSSLLGLKWNKDKDTLTVPMPVSEIVLTKREILAKLARIYDPLGFVSPLTRGGKLIYRSVCDTKSSWDTPMSESLIRLWNSWDHACPEQVEVPRSIVAHREAI